MDLQDVQLVSKVCIAKMHPKLANHKKDGEERSASNLVNTRDVSHRECNGVFFPCSPAAGSVFWRGLAWFSPSPYPNRQ